MRIGMVGLGRMGANMTKRLIQKGHEVVAFDLNPQTVAGAAKDGAIPANTLDELVAALPTPRVAWVMVPSGDPTRATIDELRSRFAPGDTIVDGGNSQFRQAMEASERLRADGIGFIDAGVSGGVWGLEYGYCLMVGGEPDVVAAVEPIFLALAPEDGYAHVGPSGAGHFTKMVHNGIEYGMLQAYAEGFALMEAAPEFSLNLHQIANLWNHGSVVRSWLLELAELALTDQTEFDQVKGYVEDSGEGRWTVEEAIQRAVSLPVITSALFARFSSRQPDSFAAKIVAALRNQFGGHRFLTESSAAAAAARAAGDDKNTGPEAAATGTPDG